MLHIQITYMDQKKEGSTPGALNIDNSHLNTAPAEAKHDEALYSMQQHQFSLKMKFSA